MKKFYDIHTHLMDLSHPNLSSFLLNDDLIDNLIDNFINLKTRILTILAASFIPKNFFKKEIKKKLNEEKDGQVSIKAKIGNCLTFFEIPIEYQFLILDYFLKTANDNLFDESGRVKIKDEAYDKIVLCPLIMDFGYKNIERSEFYNLVPTKPIAKQVGDLLYAIRTYYRFNLVINKETKKMRLSAEIPEFENQKDKKLFEIYPFMGLDTRNYTLEKLKGNSEHKGLLIKYFSNFSLTETAENRRNRLFEKMGKLDNNMHSKEIDYNDIFAGIKVYPQLGFNPYPEKNDPMFKNSKEKADTELEKVRFLYQFCCERRIPITTHCSDGGFKTGDYDDLTNPAKKWSKVLKEYPSLTLNFAHFGIEKKNKKTEWQKAVIDLVTRYSNVYTDISCNESTPAYYKQLNSVIKTQDQSLKEKILYGSDFSINLLATSVRSYNQYLKAFFNADLDSKEKFYTTNSENFLFGSFNKHNL